MTEGINGRRDEETGRSDSVKLSIDSAGKICLREII
jgi:hypothetical protein